MSRYLSQPRIEDPICLEPNDISFLHARLSEAKTDIQTIEDRVDELGVQISELVLHQNAKLVSFPSLRNALALVRQRLFKFLSKASTLSRNSGISQDCCIISKTDIAVVQTIKNRVDELKAQISELALQQDVKLVKIASLRSVPAPFRRHPLKIFSRVLKLPHNSEHSRNDYIISQAEIVVQTNKIRLEELGAQISELALQKDTKLVEIASFRNVLAPVRRLPMEILSEVFELSRDSDYFVSGNTVHRYSVRRMFILTSVCAAWRKAAHATPRLWSKLSISMEHLLGSHLEWVHDWITRSQRVALDLKLDFWTLRARYNESFKSLELQVDLMSKGKQLLDHIMVHFGHKIRSLEIEGHPSFIPLLLQHSLFSLEEVSFIIGKSEYGNLTNHFPKKVEISLNAPKLHRFKIDSDSIPGWIQDEQLTPFTDPVVILLPQCSQLVSLDISTPCNFPRSIRSNGILFPALKTLRTTYYFTGDNILCYIIAPLLENLSLNHTSSHLHRLIRDMTSFQQRAVTALSFLAFDFRTCTWDGVDPSPDLITILSLFPTVHTLNLKISFCRLNALFKAMTCGTSEGLGHHVQLLPSLTDLTLRGGFYLQSVGLESMVLSRWWPDEVESGEPVLVRDGISRLEKVTLDIACFNVKQLDIFALWRGLGLQDRKKRYQFS